MVGEPVAEIGVLFCDQVGSTALMTRLGDTLAEEIRLDVSDALHQSVELCRGEVINKTGDGLMVVFSSGPDDALRCGRLMVARVMRLARRELWSEVQFKVGVSHGSATFDHGDWHGAVVNLAARLCAEAAPCQVLAAQATLDMSAQDPTSWQSLPAVTLKGFPEPVPVSGCLVADVEVAHMAVPTELDLQGTLPLAGREGPLNELSAAWLAARSGASSALRVVGTPGMGVSRLLGELASLALDMSPGELPAVLSAHGGGHGGWEAQLVRSYAASASCGELREVAAEDAAALARLCPLVGLRLGVDGDRADMAQDELVARFIGRVAARRPVLMILDGLKSHPGQSLLEHLPARHCLTLVGERVGDDDRLTPQATRTITLEALNEADTARVLAAAAGVDQSWRAELASLAESETGGVPRDVAAAVDEVVRAGARNELSRQSALDAVRRSVPYRGLQVFSSEDEVRFYGRDRAIDEVLSGVAMRSVVIVGSSGSGKSSLVRAGCLPRLVRQGTETLVFSPGEHPVHSLASVWCRRVGGDPASLATGLREDPAAWRSALPGGHDDLVLVVDQLEECFTVCTDEAERASFLDALTRRDPRVRLLATLRGDFYGRASEHASLAQVLQRGTIVMSPPTRDELRAVIEAPAAAAHLRLEAGLSDLILADVADRPGGLPLLSHALHATWQRRHGATLTVAGYRAAGGATGAIARTADSVFGQLSESEQAVAKRIFLRLTALGEGVEDSRRRVPRQVLVAADARESTAVLDRLTAARLITAGTDADGADVEELAHEALLREWPRLRDWLDEDRDELRLLAHLETAAREWDAAGCHDTDLYVGRRLEVAEHISTDKLNDLERNFLSISVAQRAALHRRSRRAARRLQVLAVVLVLLLAVSVVAGLVALRQRTNAQAETTQARAGELAADAVTFQHSQASLSLLLAVEAHRLSASPQTLSGLLNAVYDSPHIARVEPGLGGTMSDFALSPAGTIAAVGYADGSFRLWNFRTGRPLTPEVRLDTNAIGLDWATSSILATYWSDGLIRLWDASNGEELAARFSQVRSIRWGIRFGDDGRLMAVGQQVAADPNLADITLWSTMGGPPLRSFFSQQTVLADYAFTPSGDQIVTTGSYPNVIHFIDVATGSDARPPLSLATAISPGLAFSPDGTTMVVGASSGQVSQVDLASGAITGQPLGGSSNATLALAYSPDGSFVAGTEGNGVVMLWRAGVGSEVGQPFTGQGTSTIYSVQFTSGGTQLVTASASDIVTWDVPERAALAGTGYGGESLLGAAAVDTRHHLLYVAGGDARIRVWDTRTLALVGMSAALGFEIGSMDVDPETGELAVGVAAGGNGEADLTWGWGVEFVRGGAHPTELADVPLSSVDDVGFSPSGRFLALSTANGLRVFDLTKPTHPSWIAEVDPSGGGGSLSWVNGDRNILFVGARVLAKVEVRTRAVVRLQTETGGYGFVQPDPATGGLVAMSPTGRVFFDDAEGTLTGRPGLATTQTPIGADISPNGRLLAVTGPNGVLELWDLASGSLITSSLPVSEGSALPVFLDDQRLVVAGANDTIALVTLNPDTLVQSACAMAGRNLTQQEFRDYLGFETYHRTCPQWPAGT